MASLIAGLLLFAGFGSANFAATNRKSSEDPIARHITVLKTGTAQARAAAAYWLGRQRQAAASAVDPLVELLGDSSEVDPMQYRVNKIGQRLTLGEEAAAALVKIGHPAIDPLIRVLKTSPLAEARKNAAWALGALHEAGATGNE